MPPHSVTVDMLTNSYRIIGQVPVSASGMLGQLSDDTISYFEVIGATMARIHTASKTGEKTPVVRVVKRQIVAIGIERREDVGPMSVSRTYARVSKYPIRLTTSIFELEGTFEYPGRFEFGAVISDGTCDFIPVYDATLGAVLFPSLLIQSPVMLFNRSFLNTLVLINEGISLNK